MIEKRSFQGESGAVRRPVRTRIKAGDLTIYQQTGESMGVRVNVIAREGEEYEPYTMFTMDKPLTNPKVAKGHVFVEVDKGQNRDLGPFWEQVEEATGRVTPVRKLLREWTLRDYIGN